MKDVHIEEMLKRIDILIVDDHPFIIEGYKNAITRYNPADYNFVITQAKDCKSAYEVITDPESPAFDIAFLDISMPAYDEKDIFSGEDLARLLLNRTPECKIILLTMYSELLKIKTILRNINPHGLIIKNDLTFEELLLAFDQVINDKKYYSQSVEKMLAESPGDSIEIDEFDKQILFHLSKGTATDHIPEYIPIPLGAVEKRKINMKQLLSIPFASDQELFEKAKSLNLY
jgi:DNA-binding NarL/FixJ family response regulator